jgi:dipeptidyl-peptidase 4
MTQPSPCITPRLASLAAALLLFPPAIHARQLPASQPATAPLTVERVSAEPDTDLREKTLRWSPDGARAAWLEIVRPLPRAVDKTSQMEIRSFFVRPDPVNPDTTSTTRGQPSLPGPVLLVSAAKVTASLRGSDAPLHRRLDDDGENNPFLLRDFAWSRDHGSLLLIGVQSLAWLDLATGSSHLLVAGDDPISSASISPNGLAIAFVRNCSLYSMTIAGQDIRLIARSPAKDVCEGEPDWPYRNELHLNQAFWWAPDSQSIAWLETDDRAVAKYTLRYSSGDTREIVYPKPGDHIPTVHLFVKHLATASADQAPKATIDLGPAKDVYLPRIAWLPDSRHLAVERLDRFQHKLELLLADLATRKSRMLITEKDPYWINLSNDPFFLADSKRFLWSSESTGFRHLYLYDLAGKQLAQLTHGDWEVTSLDAVDEAQGRIYFTATEKSPLERQLYQTDLSGSGPTRVTANDGTHQARFSPDARSFIDAYSSHSTPPRLDLYRTSKPADTLASTRFQTPSPAEAANQRNRVATHHDDAKASGPPPPSTAAESISELLPVEFFTLKLHMGTETHAFLIKPPDFDPAKKYPVIVYLPGGPGEQLVRDAWAGGAGLWMQLMARKGYLIFALDHHGTAGRGHYFEEPLHLRLAAQELIDQRDGVSYLGTLPYVDTARLGVCGWGYGGFLAVHAMLDRPVPFRAGFAGAPVIDWHYYDAVFPERYLENSVVHADGWNASSPLENDSPRFFKSSMMIALGTTDEFVHMENLLTLQDALLDAGKSAEILLLPDRGHFIDDPPARLVLFRRMTEFFVRNL